MFYFIFDYKYGNDRFCRPLTAVRSVEPIAPDLRRKSLNVWLLDHSFSSLLTDIFNILMGFYQKIIFKLSMVNFNMYSKIKLLCLVMYHCYDVIKFLRK